MGVHLKNNKIKKIKLGHIGPPSEIITHIRHWFERMYRYADRSSNSTGYRLNFLSTMASDFWCQPAKHLPKCPTNLVTTLIVATKELSKTPVRKRPNDCSMWSLGEDDVNPRVLKVLGS